MTPEKRRVLKWVLQPDHTGRNVLPIPRGSTPIWVDFDTRSPAPAVWFECPDAPTTPTEVHLIPTGDEIPLDATHVGSLQRNGVIFHVYVGSAA